MFSASASASALLLLSHSTSPQHLALAIRNLPTSPLSPLPRSLKCHPVPPPCVIHGLHRLQACSPGPRAADALPAAPQPVAELPAQDQRRRRRRSCRFANVLHARHSRARRGLRGRGARECADDDAPTAVLVKARIWSEKVAKKMPRTPTVTPPNEPETIDAMELMAGLEASTPPRPSAANSDRRSFSFCPTTDVGEVAHPEQRAAPSNEPEFDPEILSAFRKALAELPPQHPSLLRSTEPTTVFTGIVRARVREFQQRIDAKKANANALQAAGGGANAAKAPQPENCPPEGEGKVVLYFTSIRGVRKTYEDCCLVRSMLEGCGVRVDERDVSMDRGFREEIKKLLGAASLPRVFANRRYVGGAEEMKQLHESGELRKAVEDCEAAAAGKPCARCGDLRFVLCGRCSGSCRLRAGNGEEAAVAGSGFRRCPECNENGLLRCPRCC